jgi:hypothetical protein
MGALANEIGVASLDAPLEAPKSIARLGLFGVVVVSDRSVIVLS